MTTKTLSGLIAGTVLAAALALPVSFAAASSELDGATLGKSADEVKSTLTAQGYEVRKVENEDGKLEAYAVKDGKKFEIYVDPASGAVTEVKAED
jgi:hypothetical protein